MKAIIRVVLLVTFSVFGLCAPASALVTDWYVVSPPTPNPIYYGDVAYGQVVNDNADPIVGYFWYFQPNPSMNYVALGNDTTSGTFSLITTAIGQLNIELVVEYGQIPGSGLPAHAPTRHPHFITILPPDGMYIKYGLYEGMPIGGTIDVVFQLTGAGRQITAYGSIIWAQEKYTAFSSVIASTGQYISAPLNVWVPAEGAPNAQFHASDSSIVDNKALNDSIVWQETLEGEACVDFSQVNRVKLPHIGGPDTWYEFGPFHLTQEKVTPGIWMVTEQ